MFRGALPRLSPLTALGYTCGLLAILAAVTIGAAASATPAPTCPAGQHICSDAFGPTPDQGPCYDPATQTCCGEYSDDCWTPPVCNSSTETCCLAWQGCEYAASPVCCSNADSCCGLARHEAICVPSGFQCCALGGGGFPDLCPDDTACCAGYWSSSCCASNQTCCQYGYANGGQLSAACCNVGESCNIDVGCVADTCDPILLGHDIDADSIATVAAPNATVCCEACALNAACVAVVAKHALPPVEWVTLPSGKMAPRERPGAAHVVCELKAAMVPMVPRAGHTVLVVNRTGGV